jgi:hypothetical protein
MSSSSAVQHGCPHIYSAPNRTSARRHRPTSQPTVLRASPAGYTLRPGPGLENSPQALKLLPLKKEDNSNAISSHLLRP